MSYEYHPYLGVMTKMTQPDGTEQYFEYDYFGLLTEQGYLGENNTTYGEINYSYSNIGEMCIRDRYIGVKNLKIFGFGPRPQDFIACNAPIKPLFDLGVEIMENSELDLFEAFHNHADDSRIGALVKEMEEELGSNIHLHLLSHLHYNIRYSHNVIKIGKYIYNNRFNIV